MWLNFKMKNIYIILILLIFKKNFRVSNFGNLIMAIEISERRYGPYYIRQSGKQTPNEYMENSYYSTYEYFDCDSSVDLTLVPNKCHSFRRCFKGKLYIMRCPYGTVFDERLKVCNFPSNIRGYCGNPSNFINMNVF